MPLEILLVLVVGGIAGIALLLHVTGKSRLRLLTPESARAEWLRHAPGDEVIDVTVAHDGHAALIRATSGKGLLWSFGADTVARQLLDFDWMDHPKGIEVQFHDFSTPKVILCLDDTERQHWRLMIDPS